MSVDGDEHATFALQLACGHLAGAELLSVFADDLDDVGGDMDLKRTDETLLFPHLLEIVLGDLEFRLLFLRAVSHQIDAFVDERVDAVPRLIGHT